MRSALCAVFLVACTGAATPAAVGTSGGEAAQLSSAFLPEYTPGAIDVQRWDGHIAIAWGGRVYGSSGDDVTTNVTVALSALALSRTPLADARIAVLGIGTGVETGMFLDARVAHVDVFEREPAVRRAAAYMAEHNHLHFEDGEPHAPALTVIASAAEPAVADARYDAIVYTPSLTVMAEPHRLFTTERLAELRDHLAPGGVVVMHLQMYEIRPWIFAALLRTFARAFPFAVLFTGSSLSSDGVLVGSSDPIALDLARAETLFASPITRLWLHRGEVDRPTDLAAQLIFASSEEMLAFASAGPVYDTAHPLAPSDLPRRPPWPDVPNSEEGIWSVWEDSVSEFQSDYDNGFIDPFYADGWRYGHACTFMPPVACRFFEAPADASLLAHLAVSYAARGLTAAASTMRLRATELDPTSPAAIRASRVVSLLLAEGDDPHLPDRMHDLLAVDAILPFASELDALWGQDAAFVEAVLRVTTSYGPSLAPDTRVRLGILEMYGRHALGADHGARAGLDALLAGNHEILDQCRDAWYLLARIDYEVHPARATASMDHYLEIGGELGAP